jgi:ABC-type uncharacterized transport system auxiliary subunit
VLLGGMLALAGCGLAGGLSERPYVERRDWPLLAARPITLPPRQGGKTLLLRTLRAGPGAQARGLQTIQPDGSVRTAFYEEWAAPPAEAMEAALRAWLQASGQFAAVLNPGSRAEADLVFDGELQALVADPPAQQARAALSYVLLRQRGLVTSVLLQAEPTARVKLAGDDPPVAVRCMTQAVVALCAQVEAGLMAYT